MSHIKTSAQRKAEGDLSHRPKKEDLQPILGRPKKPKTIRKVRATEMWDLAVTNMEKMGILGTCDLGLLESYCLTYQRVGDLQDIIDKEGYKVLTRDAWRVNPAVASLAQATKDIAGMSSLFGFNPMGRARMGKPVGLGQEDPIAEFNKRRDAAKAASAAEEAKRQQSAEEDDPMPIDLETAETDITH